MYYNLTKNNIIIYYRPMPNTKRYGEMSYEEQAKFVADYQRQHSVIGQLEKRLAKLETVVKNLEDMVKKYKNLAAGTVDNMRSRFTSFTRKGKQGAGKKRRTSKRKTRRKKHRRK